MFPFDVELFFSILGIPVVNKMKIFLLDAIEYRKIN